MQVTNLLKKERTKGKFIGLEIEISFFYEDDLIISDCNKVFIGKTADFIFLRNFERKENFIYKVEDISELRIRDLR